jgi:hypothetical protein
MDIEKLLKSIGMTCFVKYYEIFAGDLTNKEVIEILKISENYEVTGCRTRVSCARRIIRGNQSIAALQLVVNSNHPAISLETKNKAALLIEAIVK